MSRKITPTGTRRPAFATLEERLWWARETAPLTQQELADLLGVSKWTVGNYESGVGHPKEARLILWANACDVDYGWLAGDFYDRPDDRSAVGGDAGVNTQGRSGVTPGYVVPRQLVGAAA